MDLLVALLVIAIGLAALFAGYRLFRELLPLFGFVVGFVAGAGFIASWLGEGFLQSVLGIAIGVVLGLFFAVIAYAWWWVGVILVVAGFGFAIGYGVLPAFGIDVGIVNWIVGVAVAVILAFGAAALRLPRAIIIVETALWGAAAVIAGVLIIANQVEVEELGTGAVQATIGVSVAWTIAWLVLAVVGMGVQSMTARDYELMPPDDEPAAASTAAPTPPEPPAASEI